MKSKLLLISLFSGLFSSLFAQQDASSFSNEALSTYNFIWGFLKYHTEYPNSTDWDQTLLNDYSRVKQYASEQEIQNKIDSLFSLCGVNKVDKDIKSETIEMSWLSQSLLSPSQSWKVNAIANSKLKFKQKYIVQTNTGRLNIKEKGDTTRFVDDEAMRFLGLCRYWNVFNYWSPYRELIYSDWNQKFQSLLPVFQLANDEEKYYYALLKLASATEDGHAIVMMLNTAYYNKLKYLPFAISYTDGHTYIRYAPDSFLVANGLQLNDEILEIDGVSAEDRWSFVDEHFRGSNIDYKRLGSYLFAFTEADSFELKVKRNEEVISREVASFTSLENSALYNGLRELNTEKWKEIELQNKKFVYVNMGELEHKDIRRDFKKTIKSSDNLIVDLRNYPHGVMYKMNRLLFDKRKAFAKFTLMNLDDPGSYRQSKPVRTTKGHDYKGKIFVLCNSSSISHSEFNIMSLQAHPNTVVIGSMTAGADGDVAFVQMPYNNIIMFSSLGVFYPDGAPTQKVGVNVDYKVNDSTTPLPLPEDPLILKALELMN